MIRSITGFHPDPDGEWVAELSCLHGQHVRHRPPFLERPWVTDAAGRAGRIGTPIECPLCDRAELPDGLAQLTRLGPWDAGSLPAALRRSHRVPEGRWGELVVDEGSVTLHIDLPGVSSPVTVGAGGRQPIPPGVEHHVEAAAPVVVSLVVWGPAPPVDEPPTGGLP